MTVLAYLVAIWLFAVGTYGAVTSRHIVHLITCLTVAQSSTYVLLLAVGYRAQAHPPVFVDTPVTAPTVDALVQAMVLTDIVVGATVTALLLALAVQVYKRTGQVHPGKLPPMRG